MVVCAGSLIIDVGSKVIFELGKKFMAPNCRRRADTLKLQSKLSNSAAEQTGLRYYMASKVDCKCVGNKVGVAAYSHHTHFIAYAYTRE